MLNSPLKIIEDLEKLGITKIPKTVFWAIISYCNAVCTTCSFYQVPKSSWKYVKTEDAKKAIDILYDSGFRMTSLTGGEPLMHPDLFEICDYLNSKGMIVTYMPTNGILITKEIARKIKRSDIRLVGISVDLDDGHGMGLTRKISDLGRVVTRAREYLEDAGVKTYAGIVLTRSTLDIPRVLDLVSSFGFERVIFSYPQTKQLSSYLASAEMQDLVLNAHEIEGVVQAIKSAKKTSELSVHNPEVSLDELVRHYRNVPRQFKCHGGRKLFYLDWNLDLYKCFTLPKKYGNLLQLGKVEDFDENEGLCDLCTQQAFRDHDPFYNLAATFAESKDLLASGHVVAAMKRAMNRETYESFKALREFLNGGFL